MTTIDTMQAVYRDIVAWQERQFGTREQRGPEGALKHLLKEIDEALAAADPAGQREEIVDCLFMLIESAWRSGITLRARLAHSYFPRKIEGRPADHLMPARTAAIDAEEDSGPGRKAFLNIVKCQLFYAARSAGMSHADLVAGCRAKLTAGQLAATEKGEQ